MVIKIKEIEDMTGGTILSCPTSYRKASFQ